MAGVGSTRRMGITILPTRGATTSISSIVPTTRMCETGQSERVGPVSETMETVDLWTDSNDIEWMLCFFWKVLDGRLEVVDFSIRAKNGDIAALSPSILRRVPLARVINARRVMLVDRIEGLGRPPLSEKAIARSLDTGKPNMGRGLTDEDLKAVAHFYREAYQTGLPVQRYVAEKFGVSIPTAGRRILLARRAGFIDGRFIQTRGRSPSLKV